MTKSRKLAYLALTTNAIIWGCAFPIIKPAFEFITPLQFLYLRFLVAGLVSLPILIYFYIKLHPKTSYIIKVLLIESIQILALPILYLGLEKTSALEASLIGATGPIFVVLGGVLFLHERESKREWQGLALSLFGSLLLVAEPLITGNHDTPISASGNLYVLGYNLLYTIYALIAKKHYKKSPPLYLGSLIYLLSTGIYASLLLFQGNLPLLTVLKANSQILIPTLYMAIPGSILAFALYLYAQSKIEVSEASLFTYLNGIISLPAAWILLSEKPSFLTLIAILVITLGVLRAEKRTK